MSCANETCGHSKMDHAEYAYVFEGQVRPFHPKAVLTKVSERCLVTIDFGGDDGRTCGCLRFQKPEEGEVDEVPTL